MPAIKRLILLPILALSFAFSLNVHAAERATKEEAKAMLLRGVELTKKSGLTEACKSMMDKGNADFHDRELYVFVLSYEGVVTCHGANAKLVGKNIFKIKDPTGFPLIQELLKKAKAGGGWVDYRWANPETKKVEKKSSIVFDYKPEKAVFGVGVYPKE